MNATDENLARLILSNNYAKRAQIESASAWGAQFHPTKDVVELLFMRGVIDRSKVGLIRRLAKMDRPTKRRRPGEDSDAEVGSESGVETRPSEEQAPAPKSERAEAETRELPTRAAVEPAAKELSAERRRRRLRKGQAPERVGRYEIIEKVAAGGMGVVYKARHPDLERFVALKILTPRGEASSEAMARFQREAKTASRLSHPNIVAVHDAGVEDDLPFLVMDFVDGPNLDGLLKEEGIGFRKAAQITQAIALALQHAHEEGVVHRDVKPENVIMDRKSGEPKITDFGIVKIDGEEDEGSKLTQTGYTLGSPCYMAPEQAAGRHDLVGPQSDVYSLAATLYEMLCGQPPFDGEGIHDIMTKVVREDPVSIGRRNPAVPRDLAVVCMKGLEKEQARRYSSAKEFARDLERYLDDEPVLAKPIGLWTRSLRVIKRNKLSSALVCLLVLALLGGLLLGVHREREQRRAARDRRDETVAAAVARVAEASSAELLAKRHAWFKSLRDVAGVLREDPAHPRALALKRELVLELGDHLLESGETSFAEFVYTAYGADVIDEAVIQSRVQTALVGNWENLAEEAERAGDLDLARQHYEKGVRTLQEAGLSGARLQRRIRAITRALERAQRADDLAELVGLAKSSAAQGDHAAAVLAYRKARELAPDERDLEAHLQHHLQKAREQVLEVLRQVTAARARAGSIELVGDSSAVTKTIAQGDFAQRRGDQALAKEDFALAIRNLREALTHHRSAYALANALRAEQEATIAAEGAAQRNAERFAPRELGTARDYAARAKDAFERGDHDEAARLYAEAATSFRRAGQTGGDKGKVAGARDEAQSLRRRALAALPKQFRTLALQAAEDDFSRAEAHYNDSEFVQAQSLYERAGKSYEAVLTQAPKIQEAYSAQAQVRGLRKECEEELALEFASEDFSRARQSELDGDGLMTKDPDAATEKFKEAAYRYGRALSKSRPHAIEKREYETRLQRAMELRQACLDEGADWKESFKRAEDYVEKAQAAVARRYWNGAKRTIEKAIRSYAEAVPQ